MLALLLQLVGHVAVAAAIEGVPLHNAADAGVKMPIVGLGTGVRSRSLSHPHIHVQSPLSVSLICEDLVCACSNAGEQGACAGWRVKVLSEQGCGVAHSLTPTSHSNAFEHNGMWSLHASPLWPSHCV